MLAQVLADDSDANLTDLRVAPRKSQAKDSLSEYLRLAWQGPKGQGKQALILNAFFENTWSEAVNPDCSQPSTVFLTESDLSPAWEAILQDDLVAAGARRPTRPAWLLRRDLRHLPTLANPPSPPQRTLIRQKMATFHALHWDATPILDTVYPWLPRFSAWLQTHCATLLNILKKNPTSPTPYQHWLARKHPTLTKQLPAIRDTLSPNTLTQLQTLLSNPTPFLTPIQHSPQTILHGNWHPKHLCLQANQLILSQWQHIQVGPAAWDLYTYLNTLPAPNISEEITQYLTQVQTIVPLSESDQQAFRDAYERCSFLAHLLHPEPNHMAQWIDELMNLYRS